MTPEIPVSCVSGGKFIEKETVFECVAAHSPMQLASLPMGPGRLVSFYRGAVARDQRAS